MHYQVCSLQELTFSVPHGYTEHARGYERADLMDRSKGSIHMGAGVGRLQPGGSVAPSLHAYEKGLYLLDGELELKREGVAFRLCANDYAS